MVPDRLYIDEADRELYDRCEQEGIFFKGCNNKDRFMFAMSIGFKNDFKRSLSKKFGFFYVKDLRTEDESLINAVAVLKHGIDGMVDKKACYVFAEEYARGGIKLLSDKIEAGEYGSFWKHYEKEVNDLLVGLPSEEAS